ncbi:MAG TPA: hypothetical protein VJ841_02945 [Candidatus Saccharimonadales bacterium]|nr:hypothetical protein [Candidatus Saccharimonadales bacterium]
MQFVSLVFVNPAHVISFRDRLRAILAKGVQKHGRFTIHHIEGRNDWFVEFSGAWPEDKLDASLKEIATELGADIYMEPGLPISEIIPEDERSFGFTLDTRRRRPDNR